MSALAATVFSPVILSLREEFVAPRPEGLLRTVYYRSLRQPVLVAANMPEWTGRSA